MEHHKNIKCSLKEMQALFENREYNYSIRYFEQIKEGLFKATIHTLQVLADDDLDGDDGGTGPLVRGGQLAPGHGDQAGQGVGHLA